MKQIVVSVIVLLGCPAFARADTLTYFREAQPSGTPRFLFNFDTDTGISTLRATVPGTERFFGFDVRPSDNSVFAIALAGGLWRVNIDTGTPTFVGNTGLPEPVGIAFNPLTGSMLALINNGGLYSIDPATAAATFIGGTGPVDRGLSFSPAGQLFGFSNSGVLYQLNPATGSPTLVGGSGVPIASIAEDSTFTLGGLLFLNDFGGNILRVNPATGERTLAGNTGGAGLLGLFVPVIPEPSAAAVLIVGALGYVLGSRRTGFR